MNELANRALQVLGDRTLATAESCTGGGVGAALTAVSGSSRVFKGGIISYTNEVKHSLLGVSSELLAQKGAVCAEVAQQMAKGACEALNADAAVSITGIAGPGTDEFQNPVGLVYIGYCDKSSCISEEFRFSGDREAVRIQAIKQALLMIIEHNR